MQAVLALEMAVGAAFVVDHLVGAGPTTGAGGPPGMVTAPVASARSQSGGGTLPAVGASRAVRPGRRAAAAVPAGQAGWMASGPITCDTDLPLAASPPSGYNFLCRQGGIPVTWSTSHLVLYVAGLTARQRAAFSQAVGPWAQAARFDVTYTGSAGRADVSVTGSSLGGGQPGFVEDGYTTVSYRCSPVCGYNHAAVELSTSAVLSSADWVSTILHELGHVAGLNHVSAPGEVMFPYLTAAPPQAYTAGDLEGLLILAAERDA